MKDKETVFTAELLSYLSDEIAQYDAWGNDEEVEVLEKVRDYVDSKLKDKPAYSVSQVIHNMYTEMIELRGKLESKESTDEDKNLMVKSCSSCGEDHKIHFKISRLYEYVGICPNNNNLVYMKNSVVWKVK